MQIGKGSREGAGSKKGIRKEQSCAVYLCRLPMRSVIIRYNKRVNKNENYKIINAAHIHSVQGQTSTKRREREPQTRLITHLLCLRGSQVTVRCTNTKPSCLPSDPPSGTHTVALDKSSVSSSVQWAWSFIPYDSAFRRHHRPQGHSVISL